jgi:Carboxypeptidase regulatory-like domain
MLAATVPGSARMRLIRLFLVAVLAGATANVTAAPAGAQRPDTAAFRGRVVRDSDAAPVAGAEVSFPSLDQRATTDSSGTFRFRALPTGLHAIQIRRIGYRIREDTVTIVSGPAGFRTFTVKLQAVALDTVHTMAGTQRYLSPSLRAFEERRLSHAGGYFISDSVFRRNESRTLANIVVGRIPGVTTVYVNTHRVLISSRKQCRGLAFQSCNGKPDCFVALYVDGSLYFNAKMVDEGMEPPDMEHDFNPVNFAGAEYYAGGASAPMGMHPDDDGCGSLWLWTRER